MCLDVMLCLGLRRVSGQLVQLEAGEVGVDWSDVVAEQYSYAAYSPYAYPACIITSFHILARKAARSMPWRPSASCE